MNAAAFPACHFINIHYYDVIVINLEKTCLCLCTAASLSDQYGYCSGHSKARSSHHDVHTIQTHLLVLKFAITLEPVGGVLRLFSDALGLLPIRRRGIQVVSFY